MPQDTQILYILGPVGILFFFAIKEFFSYLKSKKNGKNGNGNIIKMIEALRNNDLGEVNYKLNKVDDKLDRIINILIEIKGKLERR